MYCWGELKSLELKVLLRSVRASHACNFQDVWKVSQAYSLSKSWLRPWLTRVSFRTASTVGFLGEIFPGEITQCAA